MSDYVKQLEDAAKLTGRLVKGLRWLENEGPTKARLTCINRDVQRLAGEFAAALDNSNERTHGREIEKLRGLLGTVQMLSKHLHATALDLHLRVHVLDALESLDPPTEENE